MKKIVLFFYLSVVSINAQTVGLTLHESGSLDDGYVLFASTGSTTTYLIDKCGKQVKSWTSTYRPGQSCYLLENGSLLRTGNNNNTTFQAGGKGGVIQKIDWNGNITWEYTISSALECQHHDIKVLPNGNVLAIVWELKTDEEAIAKGRNPSLITTALWSEKIIEIQQTGLTTGNVVWEWHLWDHLIQDFDTTKLNFGNVSTNPQLINVNYAAYQTEPDWIHLNSIDYNAELDQIVLSSHTFSEIWIIDHSTTTAQAASNLGGNSGKGGSILYRWGNPSAYNNGTVTNQKLFKQHNASWIQNGYPFGNQLMIFNNGNGRTGGNYSTIEIINTPVDGYDYTTTLPYLPNSTSWIYNDGNPNILYAQNISGAQQLSNGNVLYCNGPMGIFTEINTNGDIVWNYVNPVVTTGTISQGAVAVQNIVFRCTFYPTDFAGFSGINLTSGNILENSNSVSESCNLNLSSNQFDNPENTISLHPNPAKNVLNITANQSVDNVLIYNLQGQLMLNSINKNQINVENLPTGHYIININSGGLIQTNKFIKE